ncbi:hypothetical protein M5689_005196 [Euphorbia peplus]|nr:hypothetical protein M5689_005196 [Euphorbia peplus]
MTFRRESEYFCLMLDRNGLETLIVSSCQYVRAKISSSMITEMILGSNFVRKVIMYGREVEKESPTEWISFYGRVLQDIGLGSACPMSSTKVECISHVRWWRLGKPE